MTPNSGEIFLLGLTIKAKAFFRERENDFTLLSFSFIFVRTFDLAFKIFGGSTMKSFILVVIFFLTVVAPTFVFSEEIKLGFVTSGPLANLEKAAAYLAVQDASKAIGTKITLVPFDVGCTEEQTKSVMNNLKDAKVLAIIGSFCGDGLPFAAKFSNRIEIPVISLNPVDEPILKMGYPWFFSEVLRVKRWVNAISSEMEKLRVKEVTVLAWDNLYGKTGLSYWEKAPKKIRISSEVIFPASTVDFGQYLSKTKKVESIVFISSDHDAVYGIQQAIEFGFKPEVIGGVFLPTQSFFMLTEKIQRPIIFPIVYPPNLSKNREFFIKISAAEDVKRFSQSIYRSKDIIDMLAMAIIRAKDRSPGTIRDSFQSFTAKEVFNKGLSGRIKIDPKRNEWLQEFFVGQWSRGQYVTAGGPHNHEPE